MTDRNGESPAPHMFTPIPLNVDRRIDLLAVDLANCRSDLSPADRHTLARVLAWRCRSFRQHEPRR